MNKPFFWNPRSIVGMKRDKCHNGKESKKKKIPTWTHTRVIMGRNLKRKDDQRYEIKRANDQK